MAAAWPTPRVGDLVSCWFPYADVRTPGDKARPCLVSRVFTKKGSQQIWVEVAPGTGQETSDQVNVRRLLSDEFEEQADPGGLLGTHLREATIFSFGLRARLCYDHQFFSQGKRPTPQFGVQTQRCGAWLTTQKALAASSNTSPPAPAPIEVTYKKSAASLRAEHDARERQKDSDAAGAT